MFLQFIVLAFVAQCFSAEDKDCAVSPLFYEALKCKPSYSKPGDCCAESYDCSHIDSYPEDKCVLKGNIYDVGEDLPKEATVCRPACKCLEGGKINCAVYDSCRMYKIRAECYVKHKLNQCCNIGVACPPFNNVTCMVGGVEYKDGQKFGNPDDKYVECVCQEGFKGEFVEPFCRRKSCNFQIDHPKAVKQYCAPVFWFYNKNCPSQFLCPSDNDEGLIKDLIGEESEKKCKWGSDMLNLGDRLRKVEVTKYEATETTCECLVPPFVTCNKKYIDTQRG